MFWKGNGEAAVPLFRFWMSPVLHTLSSLSVVILRLGRGIHALGLEERNARIPEPGSGMTTQFRAIVGALQ
jgi:hypothetical protein